LIITPETRAKRKRPRKGLSTIVDFAYSDLRPGFFGKRAQRFSAVDSTRRDTTARFCTKYSDRNIWGWPFRSWIAGPGAFAWRGIDGVNSPVPRFRRPLQPTPASATASVPAAALAKSGSEF